MAANDVPCCETMFWAGQPEDRKNAAKILPIVKNQHLLLCTLLIGNALAMEALPIFLDALLPAWASILISVTLILAFGEIIPQSVCSRYGLTVGAKLSVVVRLIVIVLFPLSYPISKLLDWLLGKRHSALLRRAELKTLVDMHGTEAGKGGELTHDETTIINGALDMTQKTVKDAMTPISEIFSLDINSRLDEKTMGLIISKGHSRVPIYSGTPKNIIGLILVKNLITYRPEDGTTIRDLTIRKIPRVHDRVPLYDILNQFQKGHSHLAVVVKNDIREPAEIAKAMPSVLEINIHSNSKQDQAELKGSGHHFDQNEKLDVYINSPSVNSSDTDIQSSIVNNTNLPVYLKRWERRYVNLSKEELDSLPILNEEVTGIITLEDVMEELLQEEILDETDEYVDVHSKIRINMPASQISPPGGAFASRQWRTPAASPLSPLSSYNHSPILRSPVSPYIQSPFTRPTLSASPGKLTPDSPIIPASTARYSPSLQRVSRKSYDKLRRPEDNYEQEEHTFILACEKSYLQLKEVMNTLLSSQKPPLQFPKPSLWSPGITIIHSTTMQKLVNQPTKTWKLHANAKGFGARTPTTIKGSASNNNNNNENDDDHLPQVVLERIIVRILVAVGVPLAIGIALLNLFGVVKEQKLWDVPLWLPLLTTFITFGMSALGIAYGSLSTSWDEERKGSVLGLEEVKQNWVEMWKEENEDI
ncbi:hypothetical protein Patl1_20224 [Pistacia atlantica]|uniref:Uncharacterized protein n=1 Tax=Pistacia atlantica TaxID=434234 RepID=A0ACC1BJV2_9ROSI|nr:hypothetical protein Patl1_20224 [Pistacia atlantica]